MPSPLPATADCWFLTGPTASGKTAVGLALAKRLGAEILSLDSMAVYRGMDIGTAKPSADEMRLVPHHFIDCLDPSEELSLANYVESAGRKVAELRSRGREALFIGGTPLYLKALLRGIFQGPPADWELRRELEDLAVKRGNEELHARLARVDPVTAAKFPAGDLRRIIRALEVHHKTGVPISQLQRQFDQGRPAQECRVFVLQWPREVLNARIDARVDAMFAAGLVQEVQRILARGQTFSRTAGQALGYREVLGHLAGQHSLADTIELVKTRTRQFAKRQLTWFRSLSECRSVLMSTDRDPAEVAREIAELANGERGA
jgi:tRNA dimethylallyltransferase